MSAVPDAPWWRSAVIYQIYIRSFADGNGDGVGDIAGIRQRLPYLRGLGADALWITPWYPSPMADHGYDVADYRDIDPVYGTLREAEELIEEAHRLGLRIIPDIVPNHTSDRHEWFRAALAAGPGSRERARYHFRPGRGPGGALPPNNWASVFGGPAWTRVAEADGRPGEWYLHLFAPGQPDLNWDHPEVAAEFASVLRFWFERGVDGFRVDVAHGLAKDGRLPDFAEDHPVAPRAHPGHPHWDRDEVQRVYREWRKLAEEFPGDRMFVAEASLRSPARLARYVAPGGLHTAFNFDFMLSRWEPRRLREVVSGTLAELSAVGAPATWVLSNHDVLRAASRLGRPQTRDWVLTRSPTDAPLDLELGLRRARAAALLMLALPGGAYLYQGEELGLAEVEDLPEEVLQDPVWERSGRTVRGRDGCRVPMPWSGQEPPFGFSPPGACAPPWLPQPPAWKDLTVAAQSGDPASMLELYRRALRLRRAHPALGEGDGPALEWLPSAPEVLAFARRPGFRCAVNLSGRPQPLPPHREVLLASGPLDGGGLPPDTAAWLTAP
ncbi:glycoside hydrolase family 13 protein [Streptomyces aidingensis]|uniref:Alpha-glucosidase n=1 Tax=Streptomyces aidingensis TaxID=910347 RepID=A0A1I1JDB0_9ACTN|nr:glycoside hydrolase family 13 protein [Streptomyces aidingensis]SFC46589.1 alpha-glucosidase [Streptomyces aidingensis]